MADVQQLAKDQPPSQVEENGVLYVTKRISSNHKVTVPLRKRKSIKEETKADDSPEDAVTDTSTENFALEASQQGSVATATLKNMLDPSLYSIQHRSPLMGNYVAANQTNSYSATNNPAFKKMGYGYTSIKRYHDFFNSSNGSHQAPSNDNGDVAANAMPMPLYYYYNNSYLISQIVKELQITIQNVLLKNATIYSGYDTGISNSLEIHNPSDGSVVLIQFRRQNILENSFMDFGLNPNKTNVPCQPSTMHESPMSEERLLPINNFELIESSPPPPSTDDSHHDQNMKPCFVKLDKMPDDDMTEILPVEVTYSDDESVGSDSNSVSSDVTKPTNECKKCGLTFKLKIQLAHHKCQVNVDGETAIRENSVPSAANKTLKGCLSDENNDQVSVTSYINNNNFSGVTIYQVSVPEQLRELSQFSCHMKCNACGLEVDDNGFCSNCELTNSTDGDSVMVNCESENQGEHSDLANGRVDAQYYKECPTCKKRFSPYYSLKYHTSKCKGTSSSNQKSTKNGMNATNSSSTRSTDVVSCKLCNKTFSNNNKLRRHMIIHSGVKRYLCNQCGKRFGRSDHLKLHKETHSGLKPFVCNFCGKAFTSRQSLKLHMRLHNGEAPYMCNFCRKTFVQLASLKTHLKVCRLKSSKGKVPSKT